MLQQNKPNFMALANPKHLKAVSEEHLTTFLSSYDLSEDEEHQAKIAITAAIRAILQHRGG